MFWVLASAWASDALHFDVVVYGSSPAGIAAATAAGHLGMRVALYEPRCGTANASFHARICVPVVTEVRSSIRFLMRSSSPRRWSM